MNRDVNVHKRISSDIMMMIIIMQAGMIAAKASNKYN